MGKLGNIGYSIYAIEKHILIVGPEGSTKIPIRKNVEDLMDSALNESQEEEVFMDHHINTGGTL